MTSFIFSVTSAWKGRTNNRLSEAAACRTIHFTEGNHDKTARKLQHLFASWETLSEINVVKQRIVLCHYAMRVWPHHAQGAWHLYGHSHGNLPDEPLSLSLDVGVDTHDFRPWHFDEIEAIMKAKAAARESNLQAERRAVLSELQTTIRKSVFETGGLESTSLTEWNR